MLIPFSIGTNGCYWPIDLELVGELLTESLRVVGCGRPTQLQGPTPTTGAVPSSRYRGAEERSPSRGRS